MGKGKRKGVPPRQGKPEGGGSPRAGRLRTTWIRTFARKLEPAKPRLRAGTQRTGARRGIYPHGFLKPPDRLAVVHAKRFSILNERDRSFFVQPTHKARFHEAGIDWEPDMDPPRWIPEEK